MTTSFVFFHVGQDVAIPEMLVSSIRWSNPDATVIQCSDAETPSVVGISRKSVTICDSERLMTSRLNAFANCEVDGEAAYLDTDMIVVKKIDVKQLLGSSIIGMCRRSFQREHIFNYYQRDIYFNEYKNLKIDDVYPYLACFTLTQNPKIWDILHQSLLTMEEKFHRWYGDQEALKLFAYRSPADVIDLPESTYGCLPEYIDGKAGPSVIHFKGGHRKQLMKKFYLSLKVQPLYI